MKKALIFILCMLFTAGSSFVYADKVYNQLLKSPDYEAKYLAALAYYQKKDYKKSIRLLEDVADYFKGTEKSQNVLYTLANSHFYRKDYLSSEHYYQIYVNTFMRGEHYTECLFMLAYSLYKQSPEPELDQRTTVKAIERFQLFLEQFPYGEQTDKARELLTELYDKLAQRELANARLYYNLGNYRGNNYRAAIITAQNAILDFPDSQYKEEFAAIIVRSKYKEAVNSVAEKMQERFEDASDECYYFLQEYPESKFTKEVEKIHKQIKKHLN